MKNIKLSELKSGEKLAIVVATILVIVLAMFVVFAILGEKSNSGNEDNVNTTLDIDGVSFDISELMPDDSKYMNYQVITNKNNDQADVLFDVIGIDLNDTISYALQIDVSYNSAHCISIVKPKEEATDNIYDAYIKYVASKQRFLSESGDSSSTAEEAIKIAKESLIYKYKDYYILTMCDNAQDVMNKIVEKLSIAYSGTV